MAAGPQLGRRPAAALLVSRLAAAIAHRRLGALLDEEDSGIAQALPELVVGEGDVPLIRATAALAEARGPEETVEFLYTRYAEAHSRRIQEISPRSPSSWRRSSSREPGRCSTRRAATAGS
nr:hypothetical protein GCM10020093_024780 [Planobispora longispora]